ncbi:hypothetical protein VTJ83DRAFT_1531 [Remersonia thermophila]|uniref:GPI inositol-deacylase n=1 Tax=Remersonia thermophila TaxID=72144 RepID=A0ABR4DG74_9PEZI
MVSGDLPERRDPPSVGPGRSSSPSIVPFRSLARSSLSSFSLFQRGRNAVKPKAKTPVADACVEEDTHGPLGLNLLSEPPEPHVDFIFVHGLAGGSRKTWSYSPDSSTFWPKEWLPSEPGFEHVRIHSFGYESEWFKIQKSILNIDDFGHALLMDMITSPHLRKTRDTPIVLIAHSMGGLVAKKAYILARKDPRYQEFAKRIHSMYFFATPHRGSNLAQILQRTLDALLLPGSKPFVTELIPGSPTLEEINNDFRDVRSDLQVWSFYETIPMKSVLVVDKSSAVMDFPEERSREIQADHRYICKFESRTHHNYQIVLHCLHKTVEEVEIDYRSQQREKAKAEIRAIAAFLEVEGPPESDLLSISDKQLPGTCSWLTEHPIFSMWLSQSAEEMSSNAQTTLRTERPRFLWVHGPPGSGKSVICGHVIRSLQEGNLDCSYYFLKHGNTDASSLSAALRSLAFQMASFNFDIRKAVLAMAENSGNINHNDHHKIWNDIFINRVFKTTFSSPQFWVIDALDECPKKALNSLLYFLSRIPHWIPLQVFLTSRPGVQVRRALSVDEHFVAELETGGEGTKLDIASFLRSRRACVSDSGLSEHVLSGILSKSNGIFLWASMVMDQLDETYADEDAESVLHHASGEINDIYLRIAKEIANTPNLELVKCIFRWVVCAQRRLSVDELCEAVRLDISRTLIKAQDRLTQLCGNLITINQESEVHFIHRAVFSFLTQGKSELQIERSTGHVRLAEVCLKYLTGQDFAPPRPGRQSSTTFKPHEGLGLADYACAYFSFHLAQCDTGLEGLLLLTETFFISNVLTWIECAVRMGGLKILVKTIQNLRVFLSRCGKQLLQLKKELRFVAAWIRDLAYLVANFGSNLQDLPSCIRSMVPIISPPQSIIHQQFAKNWRRQRLLGVSPVQGWNERISSFVYERNATAVAASEQYLAVNTFSSGLKCKTTIYDSSTLQAVSELWHEKTVRGLKFGPASSSLVVYGTGEISLWDQKHQPVWKKKVDRTRSPVSLAFNVEEDELLVCAKGGYIYVLSAKDGSDLDELPMFHADDSDLEDDARQILLGTPPSTICMSSMHGLAALTYPCAPVTIWDIERRRTRGVFYRHGTEFAYQDVQINDLLFNPVPESNLLAIAYDGVGIVTCDPWTREQLGFSKIAARILVSSEDGKTLFASDVNNGIHILTFEPSPRVIHYIAPVGRSLLHAMAVSPDGLRLYDVRDKCCNVWEMPAALRRDAFDDTFDDGLVDTCDDLLSEKPSANALSLPAPPFTQPDSSQNSWIVCIASLLDDGDNAIVCGRRNGGLTIYCSSTGNRLLDFRLYPDHSYAIKCLAWHEKASILVISNDVDNCIAVRITIPRTAGDAYNVLSPPLFNRYSDRTIRGILINNTGKLFHIATSHGAEVWDIRGEVVGWYYDDVDKKDETFALRTKTRQWLQHPTDPSLLLMLRSQSVHVFRWATLEELTPTQGMLFTISNPLPPCGSMSPATPWMSQPQKDLLVRLGGGSHKRCTSVEILDLRDLSDILATETGAPPAGSKEDGGSNDRMLSVRVAPKIIPSMADAIGLHSQSLFYVDEKGWVSSVSLNDLRKTGDGHYHRHFFIPRNWMIDDSLQLRVMPKSSSVAMARQDDLVIFQRFLALEETRSLKTREYIDEAEGDEGVMSS